MSHRLLVAAIVIAAGCRGEAVPITAAPDVAAPALSAARSQGLRTVSFPAEDPGAPMYTRVTTVLNQIFHDGGYVAIPFFREPGCVPGDFDLLQGLHLPGPTGPGAFACPLTVSGHFLIEPDAPQGTFPVQVITTGPTPVWFVNRDAFLDATADGDLTMAELNALSPLRGVATQFHEKLSPRMENHHVVITSRGQLEDGRTFQFNVNHVGDQTQSVLVRIR